MIQDEGGDIAALCDLGAANADGRVVSQFTYDAYGSPLSYDNLFPSNQIPTPLMRCGHKGLFVDRLDVGVVLAGGVENARITPGASLLCHNRNRTYSPKLGRFLQQDPNMSGSMVVTMSMRNGIAIDPTLDLTLLYKNGASLYQYLGSKPWSRSDSLGLEWEDFYENCILPLADFADGMLPVSMISPLNALLDGYRELAFLINLVHKNVQEPAFDEEEHLMWAMDWAAPDTEAPRFQSPRPPEPQLDQLDWRPGTAFPGMITDLPMGKLVPSKHQQNMGKETEQLAREMYGAVKVGKMKNIRDRRRLYDGEISHSGGGTTYMEVKYGRGEMSWRAKKQALLDASFMRSNQGVVEVKWIFRASPNAKGLGETELEKFCKSLGIKVERM